MSKVYQYISITGQSKRSTIKPRISQQQTYIAEQMLL